MDNSKQCLLCVSKTKVIFETMTDKQIKVEVGQRKTQVRSIVCSKYALLGYINQEINREKEQKQNGRIKEQYKKKYYTHLLTLFFFKTLQWSSGI